MSLTNFFEGHWVLRLPLIFNKFKKFNPSAHNAITSEDPPEDSDNVRAADGADSTPVLLASRRKWN